MLIQGFHYLTMAQYRNCSQLRSVRDQESKGSRQSLSHCRWGNSRSTRAGSQNHWFFEMCQVTMLLPIAHWDPSVALLYRQHILLHRQWNKEDFRLLLSIQIQLVDVACFHRENTCCLLLFLRWWTTARPLLHQVFERRIDHYLLLLFYHQIDGLCRYWVVNPLFLLASHCSSKDLHPNRTKVLFAKSSLLLLRRFVFEKIVCCWPY